MQNLILTFFISYTALLFLVSWLTSRKANNDAYFRGNRKSPWFVVAYGMIGASLSGVTFMSVPGDVVNTQFTYYGVVLGYILGYLVIAYLLLPLYYKLNLTSIYQFLGTRFGIEGQKTGSLLFIISRLIGSALRMYLVIFVLQLFLFDSWGIPMWGTSIIMIFTIFLYTFKGGIKTVVWTDTLQTTFFLLALVITIFIIFKDVNMSFGEIFTSLQTSGHSKVFLTDWRAHNYFLKHIFGGMFITVTMTGLDQDMMQKTLTCKNLKDAQKNVMSFTAILVIVNAFFLLLGGLLLVYAQQKGIDLSGMKSDQIYPHLALNNLGMVAALFFVIGLIAAGYSSADGTFAALTTSFCFDILNMERWTTSEKQRTVVRRLSHVLMSLLFLGIIIVFGNYHNDALIRIIFIIAGYTYGPILGLFAFGMFTKRVIKSGWFIPIFALLMPAIVFFLSKYSAVLLGGYKFGFELLILNGGLMFAGLMAVSKK
ncbi:MAG: sodium:solute symporter [Bacteroidetes bacterium]|nr:sodium:solute symporter [Bacteroidota bacterium]MCL1968892.1 sodium:solute symporter [Bacteroidota bacterium]MCL1969007.1 sodium:solute symporter [Bacteroidota bacterium]